MLVSSDAFQRSGWNVIDRGHASLPAERNMNAAVSYVRRTNGGSIVRGTGYYDHFAESVSPIFTPATSSRQRGWRAV